MMPYRIAAMLSIISRLARHELFRSMSTPRLSLFTARRYAHHYENMHLKCRNDGFFELLPLKPTLGTYMHVAILPLAAKAPVD